MVVLSQVVGVPRSRSFLAFGIFELVCTFVGELDHLVRPFPVWAELPVCRVLGVFNNLPQNEIPNRKQSMFDLLVVCFG